VELYRPVAKEALEEQQEVQTVHSQLVEAHMVVEEQLMKMIRQKLEDQEDQEPFELFGAPVDHFHLQAI
jgi:hypothetical protein